MNILTTFKQGDEKLEIFFDEDPESPREWDNLGIMVCSHREYNLGDQQIDYPFEDYLQKHDIDQKDIGIILPLFLMDHSGLRISCGDFAASDPQGWDSGQVGVIYVTKQKLRHEYSVKKLTDEIIKRAKKVLQQEIETYDDYLSGNCYCFTHSKIKTCDLGHNHDEIIDSCGGYYGDYTVNGMLENFDLSKWKEEAR